MKRQALLEEFLPREAQQAYVILLLFCGVALFLSIPFEQYVSQPSITGSLQFPSAFFATYVLFMCFVGLNRGGAYARRDRRSRSLLHIVMQLFTAQLLVLPYLIFTRSAFLGHEWRIVLAALYVSLASFLAALIGVHIESRPVHRPSRHVGLKYLIVGCYFVAPLLVALVTPHVGRYVSVVSPFSAVLQLLAGPPLQVALIAFLIPTVMIWLLIGRRWERPRKVRP